MRGVTLRTCALQSIYTHEKAVVGGRSMLSFRRSNLLAVDGSPEARLLPCSGQRGARETQTVHRGSRENQTVTTDRRPLQHVARFILMAVYTGTRSGAITSASISRGVGRSFVDLERGIYYRLAEGNRETKKRQPPIHFLPGTAAAERSHSDRAR